MYIFEAHQESIYNERLSPHHLPFSIVHVELRDLMFWSTDVNIVVLFYYQDNVRLITQED